MSKSFRLPKNIPLELVQKALSGERRNFDEFLALTYGPVALGPKPIKVTTEHLEFTKTVLLLEEEAEPEYNPKARRYGFLLPVIRLWLRENPRIRKSLEIFVDGKLSQSNGHAPLADTMANSGLTMAAQTLRTQGIERLRNMLALGKKQCSKCGKVKTLDLFTVEKNQYYPEVGEPTKPGSWCKQCSYARNHTTNKPKGKPGPKAKVAR